MIEVTVPKQNVNDESVTVVGVRHKSGVWVNSGDVIVEIETSKSVENILAPVSGFLTHRLEIGREVRILDPLFTLHDTEPQGRASQEAEPADGPGKRVSLKAQQRARELNVDLASLGPGLISVADVEKHASDRAVASKGDDLPSPRATSMSHKTAGNRLVLVGAGAHAKVCLEILKLRREFEIIGILDDEKPVGYEVMGAKVLGDSSLLQQLWRDGVPYAVNAVGSILNPPRRKQIFERLKSAGFLVPNLVHPSAIIEPSVRMGEGNQIMMGACVGSDVALGDNCIINSGAIISHDCSIGDHCHFAPGCVIAGLVQVGELAVIGMAATVFFKTTIGAGATIANGAHVFKDIAAGHFVKNTGT